MKSQWVTFLHANSCSLLLATHNDDDLLIIQLKPKCFSHSNEGYINIHKYIHLITIDRLFLLVDHLCLSNMYEVGFLSRKLCIPQYWVSIFSFNHISKFIMAGKQSFSEFVECYIILRKELIVVKKNE